VASSTVTVTLKDANGVVLAGKSGHPDPGGRLVRSYHLADHHQWLRRGHLRRHRHTAQAVTYHGQRPTVR